MRFASTPITLQVAIPTGGVRLQERRVIACEVAARKYCVVEAFIGLEIVSQLALAFIQLGAARPLARILSYAASLGLMFLLPGRSRLSPAAKSVWLIIAVLGVSLFHPTTNSLLAGGAQIALYVAILAPLFWASRVPVDTVLLRRFLLMLWAFHTASSIAGILQVTHPNLLPQTLSVVTEARGKGYVDSLRFTTADGTKVFRPMGFSDVPGAVSVSGFYSVLIGLGFLLSESSLVLRVAAFGSIAAGFTALYLSQVRAMLVMLMVCIAGLYAVLVFAGERVRLLKATVALATVIVFAYAGALAIGGNAINKRIGTLASGTAEHTYDDSRGHFLTEAINQFLPEYPLGAGLGRWGMMNEYFGDNSDLRRGRIWAEIQWTGWILDGGLPLVLAYTSTVFIAIWTAWKIAMLREDDTLWMWAAVVLAYDVGAVAMAFDYPFFVSQNAMDLWLLNATLFSAANHIRVRICVPS